MMETSTAEQPATVSEDLTAAWAEFETPEQPEAVAEVEQDAVPEEAQDVEQEVEQSDVDPVEEAIGDEEPEVPVQTAPEHWSQEDKDTFAALSELGDQGKAAQEFLLNRHKAMEGDYTRKSQELSPLKQYQAIDQIFAPYQDALKQANQTPADIVNQWATIDRNLAENPQETLHWLANQYGVELNGESAPDPQVLELRNQMMQMQTQLQQKQVAEQQDKLNSYTHKIEEFAQKTTEAGEPAHPYFEEVQSDMAQLAMIDRQNGKEPELSDLYERAVWMNPSAREKLQSAQRDAAEKKRLEDARLKAAKAKKASMTVDGTPTGDSPTTEISLREQLAQQFAG